MLEVRDDVFGWRIRRHPEKIQKLGKRRACSAATAKWWKINYWNLG